MVVAGKQYQTTSLHEAPPDAARWTARSNRDADNQDPDVFTIRYFWYSQLDPLPDNRVLLFYHHSDRATR